MKTLLIVMASVVKHGLPNARKGDVGEAIKLIGLSDHIILRHYEETIIGEEHKYSIEEIKELCELREKLRIFIRQNNGKNK